MTAEQREFLRQTYQFQCGYCGTTEVEVGAKLTVDHFQPRAHGGIEELDNWGYCCHACNEFKGDLWRPASPLRILHPLRENIPAHLAEQPDGTLVGLTETGSFHISRLQLNRPPMVARRRERQERTRLTESIAYLEEHVQALRQGLAEAVEALRILRERVE